MITETTTLIQAAAFMESIIYLTPQNNKENVKNRVVVG